MALFSFTAAADALEDLLDQERGLLLSGRIDGLLRMAGEKERMLARLAGIDAPADTLERLRVKAERNQQLLTAAARGIKSAARRLEAMCAPETGLRTYGRTGAAADLSRTPGGVNKHA